MSQPDNEPDWLKGEDQRADALAKSEHQVSNPDAKPPKRRKLKAVNQDKPPRTLKGFRIRADYQQRFDELAVHQKHSSGKKGPDLIEEALEMLFRKYEKMTKR